MKESNLIHTHKDMHAQTYTGYTYTNTTHTYTHIDLYFLQALHIRRYFRYQQTFIEKNFSEVDTSENEENIFGMFFSYL